MIKEIEKNNENPFQRVFEYIEDDKVKGYLKYSLIYDRIEIDDLLVYEPYRNQKIATKLMSYLVSIAIELHVINITLEVNINNEIAKNLYKRCGFREVALRKNYYQSEDGILMEKQVM